MRSAPAKRREGGAQAPARDQEQEGGHGDRDRPVVDQPLERQELGPAGDRDDPELQGHPEYPQKGCRHEHGEDCPLLECHRAEGLGLLLYHRAVDRQVLGKAKEDSCDEEPCD